MSRIFDKLQPAVREETRRVAVMTLVGVVLMWVVFFVLHMVMPEKVSFDYTVILGGLGGAAVAVGNFLWMGMTVQKVVSASDEEAAKLILKASYSRRMLFQVLWVIVAIAVPCFHYIAGILPLLFPGTGIKLAGILKR